MIRSGRSKRRKIRNELNTLCTLHSKFLNKEDNIVEPAVLDENEDLTHPLIPIQDNNIVLSQDESCSLFEFVNQSPPSVEVGVNPFNLEESINDSVLNETTPFSNSVSSSNFISMEDQICQWAIQFNIKHNAVNSLLSCLKNHKCFKHFPIDSRTLFGTPTQKSKEIRTVHPGIYYHFGLEFGIKKYAPTNSCCIEIAIVIDGLPLSKSSGAQFWPILAYIMNIPKKMVFLVGLYYGTEKPHDSNDFLIDFVQDANNLITNGIILNNTNIKVSIKLFTCDAPAKSYVLKVKSHAGFSSCTRCTIEGEYINNRVAFPYSENHSTKRTHEHYLQMYDEDYHISNQISILTQIDGFNSVNMFSIDYMHLVCLGVTKKLMILWFSKGPLNVRVRSRKTHELSSNLLNLNSYITTDFARKSRSVFEMRRWKATEFRLFLLYTGPIVLKNIITDECYANFMALNIAMTILLSPNNNHLLNYARELLNFFVKSFQQIYGVHNISHNIHNLLHLGDDYQNYGPLDNCSAFCFENYMKELKLFLRKSEKPLQQVINRYYEKYNSKQGNDNYIEVPFDQPILRNEHTNGPLIKNISGSQYYKFLFKSISLSLKKEKDSYFLTTNNEIVKCLNIVQNDIGHVLLIGKYFKELNPLFDDPINSSILDIFEINNISKRMKYWSVSQIKKKMMVFLQNTKLIAIPIIHTDQN